MSVRLTEQQRLAVTCRGGSLIVSAAAGAGKTAVLVQRVLGLLTDEKDPCGVDELLVVTFTNAAAGEMRQRIGDELRRRLAQSGFPHEIGLFLGYPPVDVEGFQRDAGRNCKFSGLWKVYGDVEQTKQSFERFHRCRAALLRRLEQGYSLEQVFPAA